MSMLRTLNPCLPLWPGVSMFQIMILLIKSRLDIYLEESELELNSQIDVLDYWSKSSIRYCELSFLARDLLAIPISTVASESAFSVRKKVITFLRSSLKPKTVQVVVCFDN
ncbi:hypothetical protein Gotri_012566, partial [Gossypium trilobum]|nr:hypothetical protein [Gossypium trilobum]